MGKFGVFTVQYRRLVCLFVRKPELKGQNSAESRRIPAQISLLPQKHDYEANDRSNHRQALSPPCVLLSRPSLVS